MLDKASKIIAIVGAFALCTTALFNVGYFSVIGFHFIGTVELTNVIYTFALISTAIFLVAINVLLITDTLEVMRQGWRERSALLLTFTLVTGPVQLLFVYLLFKVTLTGLATFWLVTLLGLPAIASVNLFSAVSDWKSKERISKTKFGLAIIFSAIFVLFLGKAVAEHEALNTTETFQLVTEDDSLAAIRIVRSSSAGLIISKNGQIIFFPMSRVKSVRSNEPVVSRIFEKLP